MFVKGNVKATDFSFYRMTAIFLSVSLRRSLGDKPGLKVHALKRKTLNVVYKRTLQVTVNSYIHITII